MEKGKTGMRRVIVLIIVVCAMLLTFASIASAAGNFTVCINATTGSGDNINYVLYAEPNDARDRLYDVNGAGSFSGLADFDFLFSGTADIRGGFIDLSLNCKKIESDNQYSLYFSATMNPVQDNALGSFVAGLIVTDLTNSNPEARYKLQGNVQIVECE